jgi:hypothetical protein
LTRDGSRWRPAKPGFLFPVRALARVFRGKYLAGLQQAFTRGTLRFAGSGAGLAEPAAFAAFVATCRTQDWVVYAKPPFAGPAQVLEYLGRYTHRVALSNDRRLAKSTSLARNLKHQAEAYQKASDTQHAVKVIVFFTAEEEAKTLGILRELGLSGHPDVVLIDARDDNKSSASRINDSSD